MVFKPNLMKNTSSSRIHFGVIESSPELFLHPQLLFVCLPFVSVRDTGDFIDCDGKPTIFKGKSFGIGF